MMHLACASPMDTTKNLPLWTGISPAAAAGSGEMDAVPPI